MAPFYVVEDLEEKVKEKGKCDLGDKHALVVVQFVHGATVSFRQYH